MYNIIITMKNLYFLYSILLFITFIRFLNCTSEVNRSDVKFCENVKNNTNWKCKNSESCWYYTKYRNEKRLDDYTPIQRCSSAKHGICCPKRITGSSFCRQVKNLSGWECKRKSECLHYDAIRNQNTSFSDGRDIKCKQEKICCPPKELRPFSNISKCGISPMADSQLEPKIVGGKNAEFGAWPWQVFIGAISRSESCGGVLLNENWVVTAAHCFNYKNLTLLLSQIKIRVGEHDLSNIQESLPFVERGVAQIVLHPRHTPYNHDCDIAMLRLKSPLEYAPHIAPICLPESDDSLIGENATVTGWGLLSEGGPFPSVLQEVSLTILRNDECESMLSRAGKNIDVPGTWLCAGSKNNSGDSCRGDSGGPLQVKGEDGRYFLAGIVSRGEGCARPNLPGVYMRISKFVSWIQETINGHVIL